MADHQSTPKISGGCCAVCGGREFVAVDVLWDKLIRDWQLSRREISYINRQQGFHCKQCGNNLRSMALASAILSSYQFAGTLEEFCGSPVFSELNVLEINNAGCLTNYLSKIKGHRLVCYPEYDMTKLDVESSSIDLVVHSDTLEHIKYPETAMAECFRILKPGGRCIFTVPIVVDRMTRSREGLAPSYHGCSEVSAEDQLVWTEFGADAWKFVLAAGFCSCELFTFEYPAALALIAKKQWTII